MDLESLLKYINWADKKIEEMLSKVSDDDFERKFNKIRTLRSLFEHYVMGYDYEFLNCQIKGLDFNSYVPKFKDRKRYLSTLSREDLIVEWINARKITFEKLSEVQGDQKIPAEDKAITIDRDNFILLFTDHNTYHRGQIVQLVKIMEYEGVNTDYYSALQA